MYKGFPCFFFLSVLLPHLGNCIRPFGEIRNYAGVGDITM